MNAADVEKILGYRVRIESADLVYDGLEGKATGLVENFDSLMLEVKGRRWMVPLEEITQAVTLRPYRLVSSGGELPGLMAESDDVALVQAFERASVTPGSVLEVWMGRRYVGWASSDEFGVAS